MWTWDGSGVLGGAQGSGSGSGGGWEWRTHTGGSGSGKLGGARGGRGAWTWDGGGVLGGARRSGSGGGGNWWWGTRTSGADSGAHGAAPAVRRMWTQDGGGVRGGAQGSRSGSSTALGGHGGTLGSGSGASERLRRGGAVGSVSAGAGCQIWGRSGSAAVCGTGPRRGAHLASEEASAGPEGPRMIPPGTEERGGEVPQPRLIRRLGVRRRQRLAVPVERLSWVGLGPGGSFDVDVAAGGIRFLVRGGWPLVVGGVWGRSALVLPSHALVLLVHGGLWPGWVGGWAVVVLGMVLVVLVVGPFVEVALVVVGMVLHVWP